jgi:hypothetical protein
MIPILTFALGLIAPRDESLCLGDDLVPPKSDDFLLIMVVLALCLDLSCCMYDW